MFRGSNADTSLLIGLAGSAGKEELGATNQAVRRMSGKYQMPTVLAVTALMLLALPARADEQRVTIPAECRELASRAGLPLTLTRAEAKRATAYLRVMISTDPAVARCRLALHG
jgi:hypothetical protein